MNDTIILIGPMMAGKSTIGRLLSEQLNIPQFILDDLRWDYFNEIGYDEDEARRIATSDAGMLGLLEYWKPFEVHAVERILADHNNCVIDFGAGYTVQKDETLFGRIERALAPYKQVILLLPSPDLDESVSVLNQRMTALLREHNQPEERIPDVLKANEEFVRLPHNGRLAKRIIYTNGKTPEETCAEIIAGIG
ncbi:MAG: hypothetical protein WAM60_10150 [Candidatus Promineifilaceae bacterium]